MDERSVAIEIAVRADETGANATAAELAELREAVIDRGGVPLRSPDGRRHGARFSVMAPDPASAVGAGVAVFREAASRAGLDDAPVVDVEAVTLEQLADDSALPVVPELAGLAEVADLLGVSMQLATALSRSKGFPGPAAELDAGPVWSRASVARYLRLGDGAATSDKG